MRTWSDAHDLAFDITQFLFDAGYVVRGMDLKLVVTEIEKILQRDADKYLDKLADKVRET